jgi:hypothetical protein
MSVGASAVPFNANSAILYVLLNDDESPLYWNYVEIVGMRVPLAPGQSVTAKARSGYTGSSTRLQTLARL